MIEGYVAQKSNEEHHSNIGFEIIKTRCTFYNVFFLPCVIDEYDLYYFLMIMD